MDKSDVRRAITELSHGLELAAESMELCKRDYLGAREFARYAVKRFQRANEMAEYLPYEQQRIVSAPSGQAYVHLSEMFEDLEQQ